MLVRDGTDVETGSSCKIESGSWFSEYDGETWTQGSDVDIDHIVPLKNAWEVSYYHRRHHQHYHHHQH